MPASAVDLQSSRVADRASLPSTMVVDDVLSACEDLPNACEEKAHRSRLRKWAKIIRKGVASFMKSNPAAFKRRLCRGIPAEHRWEVWKSLMLRETSVVSRRRAQKRTDFFLSGTTASSCVAGLLQAESTWNQSICVDAPRTFPDCHGFSKEYQVSLCRVLNAYAFLNPQVGYCQGMGYIVGILLLTSGGAEHETLFFFVRLMEDCGLNELYRDGFPLFQKYTQAFELLMKAELPDLQRHFRNEGVQTSDYLQKWCLTLFACSLPMQTVLLLWDSIICDGLGTVVLAAIALLSAVKEFLLGQRQEQIMQFFKEMSFGEEEGAVTAGRHLAHKMMVLSQNPYVKMCLGIPSESPLIAEPKKSAKMDAVSNCSTVVVADDLSSNEGSND